MVRGAARAAMLVTVVVSGLLAVPASAAGDPGPAASPELVRFRGPVEHIFLHPLMPAPKYTLHRGTQPQEFNKWNVTAREFRRILPQLYANDWVLVDLGSLYHRVKTKHGKVFKQRPLWLPPGKKPLVISIDDLNYPQYMVDNHLNSKVVLDKGRIATERVEPNGTTVVSRKSEIVPLLDRFVENHPDFSIDGAKGTIALTGAEGILGYRTSGNGRTARREQRKAAPVVKRLKQTGWTFASHSYAHPDLAASSLGQVQADTDKWERYVQPLLGHNTRIFVYPFGTYLAPGSAGFKYLRDAGFRVFCTISPVASTVLGRGYVIQSRVRVDGLAMQKQQGSLKRFFDPAVTLDPVRPSL